MNRADLFRKKSLADLDQEMARVYAPEKQLNKVLGVKDLTAFGIAAIVGAGIFSTIGNAAAQGGPAIILLFIFTAIACSFSALCYAEFASSIPMAGSAYTYAFYTFGELVAWIIGWDLLLEYAIGNIAVAISWSSYFSGFLSGLGLSLPKYLLIDYYSAHHAYIEYQTYLQEGISAAHTNLLAGHEAWNSAPQVGGLKLIANIPAFVIVALITTIVYIGIKESRSLANVMVGIKLLVILAVIGIGFFYVQPQHWNPFEPTGISGVMKGVSAVFFAYIGFDAISTTAEECKNPQKDLPRAIFYSLIICTILYVLVALVLTGMVSYKELAVGDPLVFVFEKLGLNWIVGIVAFTALIAMASVLLVFQVGQPRIWMSMSRDGLLPVIFSTIHPRFHTPSFSTILTGVLVAFPALFLNLTTVTDLTSIGTLFAFVIVCGGVLLLDQSKMPGNHKRYTVPYVNGKYVVPVILLTTIVLNYLYNLEFWKNLIATEQWFAHIPLVIFLVLFTGLAISSYLKNLSLIPVLGLISCSFLMTELGYVNWLRFGIWLGMGLIIYLFYSRKKSILNSKTT